MQLEQAKEDMHSHIHRLAVNSRVWTTMVLQSSRFWTTMVLQSIPVFEQPSFCSQCPCLNNHGVCLLFPSTSCCVPSVWILGCSRTWRTYIRMTHYASPTFVQHLHLYDAFTFVRHSHSYGTYICTAFTSVQHTYTALTFVWRLHLYGTLIRHSHLYDAYICTAHIYGTHICMAFTFVRRLVKAAVV